MSVLHLIANPVLGTSYGHMQLVFDDDGVFGSGDELELEVQSPNFLGIGDWDVRAVQKMDIGSAFARFQLDVDDAAATWNLLMRARDAFAVEPVAYQLGLFGAEGQNSNSYVVTMAHIADIDISAGIAFVLGAGVIDALPGAARNVLFDQIDGSGSGIRPFDLTLTGTVAGEVIRAGAGWDTVRGAGGDDILAGYGGRDWLFGGGGWDDLYGDAGRDRLVGGGGADLILGGSGNDRIIGGKGNDTMTGGGGADTFQFNGLVFEGHDTIRDFDLGRDLIRIAGLTLDDISVGGTDDAVVYLGDLTEITLEGVAAAELLAEDFLFV